MRTVGSGPSTAEQARRGVVPARAARSLWLSAVWTGAGTAAVGAVVAVAAVAICWLPASGPSGNARSAIHAGLLTFLAAVHGGITVGGLPSQFVPLGMTLLVAGSAWRAGAGLADVAADLDEQLPGRLIGAAVLQAAAFAAACAIAGRLATLGTSSVPAFGVTLASFTLFLVAGGCAMVRYSPLADDLAAALPSWARSASQAAAAVAATYLAGGALLAAASLALHHGRVESLSGQVGGGWSGVPILALGALAAPNAVVAGAAYLAGPGFAVGTGNGVSLTSGGHGLLPAFPILGGVPSGPATTGAWLLAALTLVVAGACAAVLVARGNPGWGGRIADLMRAAVLAVGLGAVLAWQAGGAIGHGRLATVGASPVYLGGALGAVTVVGGAVGLALLALRDALRGRSIAPAPLQAVVELASVAVERIDECLEATHSVVEVAEPPQRRGVVRSTLSSVAKAVTTTDEEREAG